MSANSNGWAMAIVYLNVVLYATCYQIQRPLEPYMVDKLNLNTETDSADEYAKLQSFFSIVQMLGSFVTGIILDKFSAKVGFIISYLASAARRQHYVFQAGFLCAQLAASQLTNDGPERVSALGRLTMAYTIGMVIGPSVGGYLGASGDYYFAAKLSALGSLLSVALTMLMPDIHVAKVKKADEDSDPVIGSMEPKNNGVIGNVVKVIATVWLFLETKVVSSMANAMSGAAQPLILKSTYQFKEQQMGYAMSGTAGFNAVVNGILISPILHYFNGDLEAVIGTCLFMMAALSAAQACLALPAYTAVSPFGGLLEFLGTTLFLSLFQYLLASTITGESTARVDPHLKGTLLGIEHSLFAAARVPFPQIGVMAWKQGGVSLVSALCAGVFAFVLLVWQTFKHAYVGTGLSPFALSTVTVVDDACHIGTADLWHICEGQAVTWLPPPPKL